MSISEEREYLFVYGSLQRGASHPAHRILSAFADYICKAEFHGHLFLVEDYPGAVSACGDASRIRGELYLLSDAQKAFERLDRYEGYDAFDPDNSLYVRKKESVWVASSEYVNPVTAWIYLYNRSTDGLTEIRSGDYLSYIRQQDLC
ncbi:gamma-glutamylcyclotransferase [Halalkalibaculum sp. DA3122]|uniref:gamma-glutamylcyclotransferase family protein n=1 Tax=unclassified Halalkalibaculum TaxID=2964617 RepID=UPI0037546A5E